MRINSQLGLYVPKRTVVGGLHQNEWTEFLFGAKAQTTTLCLLGGHSDDTGGSAFEVPISFMGDSSRSFLVLYCSFVDGIDRGINLPLLYTLKTSFHLSQLAASIAIGISLSPWLTKPVLGLITDTVPLFGYKRKGYIFCSAGLNAISLSLIAWASVHNFGGFWVPMCLMTLRTFGRAMIDAAAQGLLLEDCREEDSHDIQSKTSVLVSRYQAAHRLGQFINVCASGYIMATSSITTIYISMAAVHVGTMALAWSSDEQLVNAQIRSSSSSSSEEVFGGLVEKFGELNQLVGNDKAFTNIMEYSFLALAVPSYDAPFAYYLLDARHFSVWDISIVNIVQTSGSLIAPVMYAQFFQRSKYSTLMTGLTVAAIPASLMPLIITTGLASTWSLNEVAIASVSAFALTVVNDLQMLPPSIIVAQLAPKGFEGTSFSLLTVVEGTGRMVSNLASATLPYVVGAVAPHYTRMTLYIVACSMFNVGPISAISGFDEVGKPKDLQDNDEIVSLSDLTLAGVVRELRDRDDSSIFSSDSEQSPVRQIKITGTAPVMNS